MGTFFVSGVVDCGRLGGGRVQNFDSEPASARAFCTMELLTRIGRICAFGLFCTLAAACPSRSSGTGGSGSSGGSVATITTSIGNVGNCPGGTVKIKSGPTWASTSGGYILKLTVCVYCPGPGGGMLGVSGATVRAAVTTPLPDVPVELATWQGKSGSNGCVQVSKAINGKVARLIAGNSYSVLFEDTSQRTLGSTTVTLPPLP